MQGGIYSSVSSTPNFGGPVLSSRGIDTHEQKIGPEERRAYRSYMLNDVIFCRARRTRNLKFLMTRVLYFQDSRTFLDLVL